jgi:hypothetical protein
VWMGLGAWDGVGVGTEKLMPSSVE